MFPGVLSVSLRSPPFGERLDLKWRHGATADLPGEKFQILLDPAQKTAQVRLVLHVGRVARCERRTVITKAEDALPFEQECTGKPPLFVERDAFRRQRDALDEPKPGEYSGHMSAFRRSFIVNAYAKFPVWASSPV